MIDDLPDAPDPAIDPPKTFSTKAAAMVLALKMMVTQLKAAIASLNTWLAGGAYAIPYTVDLSSTADADPTAGKLRFNAASQNTATMLFADLIGNDTVDYTSILDQFDASTSAVKGQIRIVKQGDPAKFLTFDVTARTAVSGYRKLTVTNTGGSAASPFAANDPVLIKFTRTGDKGDTANLPTLQMLKVSDQETSGVNAGNTTAGTEYTRTLNTVEKNTIVGASLASNTVTLPAGTYRYRGRAPGYNVQNHKARLWNVTDSTSYYGSTATTGSSGGVQTDSVFSGFLTIAATKTFQVKHYVTATQTMGLGLAANSGTEVYTELEFEKLL
jgi:hypothetical protein